MKRGIEKTFAFVGICAIALFLFVAYVHISDPTALQTKDAIIDSTSAAASDTSAQGLTVAQRNAVRSASQYLSTQGFSRAGLIQQLSSDFGSGYAVTDATLAVDSMNIDWDKEAVRSAKQYLDMQGFSCRGLIQQLSSSAGSRYTVSQATYAAQQSGLCQQGTQSDDTKLSDADQADLNRAEKAAEAMHEATPGAEQDALLACSGTRPRAGYPTPSKSTCVKYLKTFNLDSSYYSPISNTIQ